MTKKKVKVRINKKHFKITEKQLIDAMLAEFYRHYGTLNILTAPVDQLHVDYTINIDIGVMCLVEAGLYSNKEENTFSISIGHPYGVYNAVKRGILERLNPNDFLIDLNIQDASDDFWDFVWSFTIRRKLDLDCDIQPCYDPAELSNEGEDDLDD